MPQRNSLAFLYWAGLLLIYVAIFHDFPALAAASTTTVPPKPNMTQHADLPDLNSLPPKPCQSIEVRNMSDLEQLKNCTRVLGYVRFAYLPESFIGTNRDKVATPVEEITDYLLVYRSHGLRTLAKIFPKLQIIRGRDLLFDEYALAVYENRELLDLGLGSLLRIQAGNIRIEDNPSLCYVETVNWVQLLGNYTHQHFYHKNNKPNNHCPLCRHIRDEMAFSYELPENLRTHCWNYRMLQRRPATSNMLACNENCGIRGCDDYGFCCHPNCLSNCDGTDCDLCANLNFEGQCVDNCPRNYFVYEKTECVTAYKCRDVGGFPHDGICLQKCPKFHTVHFNDRGELFCKEECSGNFVIRTWNDLEGIIGCITINGSLTIDLAEIKVKITEIDRAFSSLTEITGFLKIVNSPQLLTLHFLRNLITIHGQQLCDDKYAIYVVNNHHLSELFAPNQKVAIQNGTLYFHLNPRLCVDKILALQDSMKYRTPITNTNISPHSNGERVICNSFLNGLNVTVEDFNSTAVRIKIDPFTTDNIQIILGYAYFIKEAPVKNVSLYDGRHGCGYDNWRMEVNPTLNIRFIINKLKPYTQYAYFVKTLTMTDYHIQADAYSDVKYFRTFPRKPGPVRRVYYTAIAPDTMLIHWWPPRKPNGFIERYFIQHTKVSLDSQNNVLSDHPEAAKSTETDCDCEETIPENSGPLPADENFYNRPKLMYEEALPNLLYTKVGIDRRVYRDVDVHDCKRHSNCDDHQPTTPNTLTAYLGAAAKGKQRQPRTIIDTLPKFPAAGEIQAKNNDKSASEVEAENDSFNNPLIQEVMQKYYRFREIQTEKALKKQDTGPDNFPIKQPRPVCLVTDPSMQYQLQNNCEPMEDYEGIEVYGHQHSYKLSGLESNHSYRISIRACVAYMRNGCGPELSIFAEMNMKDYILNMYSNGDML